MELNAENLKNEIQSLIKALKDCGGWVKRGNGEGWFNHEILVDALALITSQEQRIKELSEENERLRAENARYEAENHAEFNKWLKLEEATKRHHSELFEEAKIAVKEDTGRKMQERLRDENKMVVKRTVRKFVKMLKSHDCRCDICINEIKKEIENE